MTDALLLAIGGLVGTILTIIGNYLIARLSAKSKHDKSAELTQTYLRITETTAEQLEERINLIASLDTQNRTLALKVSELEKRRTDRDEKFAAMEAHIAALQVQINKDAQERADLSKKLSDMEVKNRALWQYAVALLEHMRKHNIEPLMPPKELESDPMIARIFKR